MLSIIFSACSNPAQTTEQTPVIPSFSITDSLDKYAGSDSLFVRKDHLFFAGEENNTEFGLLLLNDTTFIVYQKNKNNWIQTDTVQRTICFVNCSADMNGDNFKDIVITYNIVPAGGNEENMCLLYDPVKQLFLHNPYFDLPNIKYDAKTNLVLSAWWAGVVHCQEKNTYKISGDSLKPFKTVLYCPDNSLEQKTPASLIYFGEKGKAFGKIKEINGPQDSLWQIFSHEIWDSEID